MLCVCALMCVYLSDKEEGDDAIRYCLIPTSDNRLLSFCIWLQKISISRHSPWRAVLVSGHIINTLVSPAT